MRMASITLEISSAFPRAWTREPEAMILGARGFEGDVPGRSRAGNRISRLVFRMLMGQNLGDTQTGLRGIPRRLLPESREHEFDRV